MNNSIKFAAVGDIALTHKYDGLLPNQRVDYPFEYVKDFFHQYDIAFANLEAPFTRRSVTYPLKCSLKADPDYVVGLKNAGINVVSLANNHILDYQEEAMYETMRLLEKHGILYFGAGRNLAEARKPAVSEKNGFKAGFLGYCDVIIDSPFYAKVDERGVAPFQMEHVQQDIHALRPQVDLLILSLHWGTENFPLASPRQIQLGRQLIDSGADIILGHHPHVVQRLERYKGGYIAYSLGNFLFSDIEWSWYNSTGEQKSSRVTLEKKNKKSMVFSASYDGAVIAVKGFPGKVNETYQAIILPGGCVENIASDRSPIVLHKLKYYLYAYFSLLKGYAQLIKRRLKKIKRLVIYKHA